MFGKRFNYRKDAIDRRNAGIPGKPRWGGGRDIPDPAGTNTQVGPGYNAPNIHGGYPNPFPDVMLTHPQSIAELHYNTYYDWLNETGTEHTGWESWNEYIGSNTGPHFGQVGAENWSEYLAGAERVLQAHEDQYGQDHGWNHGGTSTGSAGQASQSWGGNIGGYGDLGNWSSGGSMWNEAWDDVSNQPTQTEIPDDMNCYNQYASAQEAGYGGTFNEFASLYCGG